MIQKRNRKAYVLTIIICLILIGVAAPVAFCYESPCTTTNCDPEDWISEHDNKFVHPETGCTFDVHYRYRICYDSQTGEAKFDMMETLYSSLGCKIALLIYDEQSILYLDDLEIDRFDRIYKYFCPPQEWDTEMITGTIVSTAACYSIVVYEDTFTGGSGGFPNERWPSVIVKPYVCQADYGCCYKTVEYCYNVSHMTYTIVDELFVPGTTEDCTTCVPPTATELETEFNVTVPYPHYYEAVYIGPCEPFCQ